MSPGRRRRAWLTAGGAAIALFMLAWWPGSRFGLWESSDARYIEVARSMVRSADWLEPRSNGILHFHKPPPAYWLPAAAMWLGGPSAGAARIPLALLVVGVALVLAGRHDLAGDATRARLAAFLWGTSLLVLTAAHGATADLLLTLTTTLAFLWGLDALRGNGRSGGRRAALGFWIATGVGFAIKGPVALVVPGLPLAIEGALADRDRRALRRLLHPAGPVLFLSIALPWYVLAAGRHPGLARYFLGDQTWQRFASDIHHRGEPFWFFVPVLLAACLPWLPALAASAAAAWRRGWREERPLVLAVLAPLVFFSLSGSKLATYVLPLIPFLAVLAARHSASWGRRTLAVQGVAALALGGAGAIYVVWGGHPAFAQGGRTVPAAMLLAAGLVGGAATWALRARPRLAVAGGGWAFLAAVLAGAAVWVPPVEGWLGGSRPVAEIVSAHSDPTTPVVCFRTDPRGLAFYIDRAYRTVGVARELEFERNPDAMHRSQVLPDAADLDSLAASAPRVVWVARAGSDVEALTGRLSVPVRTLGQGGKWVAMETITGSTVLSAAAEE